MYYGNEILMAGTTSPNDGYVRQDFPGGWEGDAVNKFTAAGRTVKENSIFNYIKTIANFRLKSSAIKTGKFMQFLPVDGVYVYFRYDKNQTVMCIMNTNKEPKTIDLARFNERMKDYTAALDVAAGQVFQLEKTITLMPVSNLVLELR